MSDIRLDRKNFLKQVTHYGFFAEQFPTCFSSELFSAQLPELLPLVSAAKGQRNNSKKNTTAPVTLSMYKNDVSRRVLSVPNPEAFLRLAKFMNDNWNSILLYSKSKNSLSPISFIRTYNDEALEYINCESVREAIRTRSDFINGIRQSIRISLGYKYKMKADITNCYNSMYTHSITWAVCGKERAKQFYRTKEPKCVEKDYEIADCLDCFTRFEKNNETNGIIVGPYTSRIVSEIILAGIDRMLAERGFVFKRYVDDYKFYFRSEPQAKESLPVIEKILNEFNLTLNTSKTEIQKYPYEIISDIKEKFDKALKDEGVFGVLNTASQLHISGEKGAYKYALKYLRNKPLPGKGDLQIVIPTLINIMLLDPRYGKHVTDYLKRNLHVISKEALTTVFNEELSKCLDGELQQETLLFIQLIRDLDLCIFAGNVLRTIKSDNDFAIIIALDIWKNKNAKVKRTRSEAREINVAIRQLADALNGETLSGSRWLLLYEIKTNKLINETEMPSIEMNPFFEKMNSLNITFYKSVRYESSSP